VSVSEESKITCPECKHDFRVEVLASIPDGQKLNIALDSEMELFSADGIAEIIEATVKLLKSIADDSGVKVAVLIADVPVKPKRFEIDFIVPSLKPTREE
jgi:hypothetical protein